MELFVNKFLIPVFLSATILFAGIFAIVPVNTATTVHNLIIAAINGTNDDIMILISTDHDNIGGNLTEIDGNLTLVLGNITEIDEGLDAILLDLEEKITKLILNYIICITLQLLIQKFVYSCLLLMKKSQ